MNIGFVDSLDVAIPNNLRAAYKPGTVYTVVFKSYTAKSFL
jgi:hypothetical protein